MDVRLWDCDFPEVELNGWGSWMRIEKGQKIADSKMEMARRAFTIFLSAIFC